MPLMISLINTQCTQSKHIHTPTARLTCVHLFFAAVLAASSFWVRVTPLRCFTLQQGPSPMWGGAQSMQLVSTKGTMGFSGPYLCVQIAASVFSREKLVR